MKDLEERLLDERQRLSSQIEAVHNQLLSVASSVPVELQKRGEVVEGVAGITEAMKDEMREQLKQEVNNMMCMSCQIAVCDTSFDAPQKDEVLKISLGRQNSCLVGGKSTSPGMLCWLMKGLPLSWCRLRSP